MNLSGKRHSIDNLFSVVLFGIYTVFLLLMIIFCAQAYKSFVSGESENNNLHTAAAYVTAKFRTCDTEGDIFLGQVEDLPALCMTSSAGEQEYITYIYLHDGTLKELFASADTPVFPQMGTDIASLVSFEVNSLTEDFYQIFLEDENGHNRRILLHTGCPAS